MQITLDLTGTLALMGAIAGIASLFWQLFTWRKSTHRIKVSRTNAYLYYPGRTHHTLAVTAHNIGNGPVTATSFTLSTGKKCDQLTIFKPHPISDGIPCRIEAGASATIYFDVESIKQVAHDRGFNLVQLRCKVELATGEVILSRKKGMPFD